VALRQPVYEEFTSQGQSFAENFRQDSLLGNPYPEMPEKGEKLQKDYCQR
jgi:hypothetical protein